MRLFTALMALLLAGCSHVYTDLQEDNALLQSRTELEVSFEWDCIDGKGACTTKVYSATQFTEDDFGFQDYCPDCL